MVTLTHLKGLAAIALLASLALPQSTCAGFRAPNGQFVPTVPRGAAPGAYQPTIHRHYALDNARFNDPQTWLTVGAFIWPLPLLAVSLSQSKRLRAYGAVVEPVLALAAGFVIWADAGPFNRPAIGAYVAMSAISLHFIASAVTLRRAWRAPAEAARRLTGAWSGRGV